MAATLADAAPAKCRYVNLADIPVKLADLYPVVDANVHGQPSALLLGTGSEVTVLTITRDAVDQLHGRKAISEANDKERKATALMRIINDLSIGPVHATSFQAMLHIADAPDPSLKFDAELGANTLFSHDVELSLAQGELKLFDPAACGQAFLAYWDENAQVVEMAKMSSHDWRPVIKVEVNGKVLRAVIDSGTRASTITLEAAARLGVTPALPGVVQVVSDGKPENDAWVAPFDSFKIGEEAVGHPKIRIADYWRHLSPASGSNLEEENMRGLETDMVLGADFLRAHRVLFAVSQQRLYFSYAGGKVFADVEEQKQIERATPVVYTVFSCGMGLNLEKGFGCAGLTQMPPVALEKIKLQ